MGNTRALLKAATVNVICLFMLLPYLQGQDITTRSGKDIAIAYINEVVNERNTSKIPEVYAPDYIWHGMDGIDRHTIADSTLYYFLTYIFSAFPDFHISITNVIEESGLVALNLTGTGTHKGEFYGLPPSDKKIKFREMFFFRISGGKIIEGWGVVDLDGIKSQITL